MKGPYVLWDDLEIIGSSYSQKSWGKKSGYELDNMAFVKIYLHEDEATTLLATMEAIKEFKDAVSGPANIRKTSIIEKNRIILFTSIQIEYTIEIIADIAAVKMWYNHLIE